MAETLEGWGCVRLSSERHIGRVTHGRSCALPQGFYPIGSSEYARLDHYFAAKQRAATKRLPK